MWTVSLILAIIFYLSDVHVYFFIETVIVLLFLILTTVNYIKAIRKLSALKPVPIRSQSQTGVNENQRKTSFSTTVYNMLCVYVAFVLYYTSLFCYRIVFLVNGYNRELSLVGNIFLTVVFMNSSLHESCIVLRPGRTPEIRRAVRSLASRDLKQLGRERQRRRLLNF